MDKRLISVFLLGMSSGFPWVIIGSALSAWLKDEGFSRSEIGYLGAIFIAYSINWLWSPLVDRIKLPVLHRFLGQRRSWILFCQSLIAVGCISFANLTLQNQLVILAVSGLLISFASATQDIAIDALRIDFFKHDESEKIPLAASMATSGWWTGYAALGSIPLILSDASGWQWQDVYWVIGAIMLCLMLPVLWIREPNSNREQVQSALEKIYAEKLAKQGAKGSLSQLLAWLVVSVFEPFAEFFKRNGIKLALTILLFIFTFKLGEAILGRMSIVFYKEIGFSNTDIGIYSKMITWWVTVLFSLIGGWVTAKQGIVKGLVVAGIAMASSNLLFAVMAQVGPNLNLFIFAVIVDGFTAAWGTVAFVSFISLLCSHTFSASQYALMASIGTVGRTFIGAYSGVMVDALDGNWTIFFIITTLMIIPALFLLWRIKAQVSQLETKAS
ncbi:AmpG family muropeptide MFS transporter [Saccharobesus litoralis]|nr:MFS transporter [Saccharobesus litoralis]